jgi:ABC-type xylose transport system permease subunit
MNLVERAVSPTPTFFQKLRNIGLALAAISAAIITSPAALPAIVVTIAGYLAVAGTVLGAVSQITIPEDKS